MSKQYINPFHPDTIQLTNDLDNCLINSDWQRQRELVDEFENRIDDFNGISQANIYYCLGTTYSSIGKREPSVQNIDRQLFCFQKSIDLLASNESEYADGTPYILGLYLSLYTNYANLLDACGRKIPAIKYYLTALTIDQDFSMALGNLGKAYHHYAMLLWNHVPKDYFHYCAHVYLSRAINKPRGAYPEAIGLFKELLDGYNPDYIAHLEKNLDMGDYKYTGEEEKYRKWVMTNVLFLNPLNDLPFRDFYIATDDIHLPNMIMKLDEKPVLHGLYNQLKQEYIFSRYLFYESLQDSEETHFADKETCLLQFADYPSYSIRIEKMKTAFRIVYSLFDKTGFFLNQYFRLGIYEKDIYFGKVWRSERLNPRDQFTNILQPEQNFALGALKWIGKELLSGTESPTNSNAVRIGDIRNALEHKYVKVYSDIFPARIDGEVDDLAFYISESELEEYTYKLLSLLREALINLAITVHIEEMKKRRELEPGVIVPSIPVLHYEDDWKV